MRHGPVVLTGAKYGPLRDFRKFVDRYDGASIKGPAPENLPQGWVVTSALKRAQDSAIMAFGHVDTVMVDGNEAGLPTLPAISLWLPYAA